MSIRVKIRELNKKSNPFPKIISNENELLTQIHEQILFYEPFIYWQLNFQSSQPEARIGIKVNDGSSLGKIYVLPINKI